MSNKQHLSVKVLQRQYKIAYMSWVMSWLSQDDTSNNSFRVLVLVSTASWLLFSGLLRIYAICRAIAAMRVKTKRPSLTQDMDKEEVEKVMKRVDNRNLRRISRMLLESNTKAAEEQEKLKDISMQKVFKSVETRNIRKISKSLQVRFFPHTSMFQFG